MLMPFGNNVRNMRLAANKLRVLDRRGPGVGSYRGNRPELRALEPFASALGAN